MMQRRQLNVILKKILNDWKEIREKIYEKQSTSNFNIRNENYMFLKKEQKHLLKNKVRKY